MARSSLLQRAGITGAVVAALVFGQPSMGQALSADPAGRGATAAWQDTTPAGKKQAADRKEAAARKKTSDELAAKSTAQRLADKPDVLTADGRVLPREKAAAEMTAAKADADRTELLPPALRRPEGAPQRWMPSTAKGDVPAKARMGAKARTRTHGTTGGKNTVKGKGANSALPGAFAAAELEDGTITGTVTDEATGDPLENVCVTAFEIDSPDSYIECSDAMGRYTLTVPEASYQLLFEDHASNHIGEWFMDPTSPNERGTLPVAPGSSFVVDAALAYGGSVAGTATSADGTPLANVCATLQASEGDQQFWGGCTDESGQYWTAAVPAGDYRVVFTDHGGSFMEQWYEGAATREEATLVTVTEGDVTTGINARMVNGGTVSGTVTDDATGAPLGGICVDVQPQEYNGTSAMGCTDEFGRYTTSGLPTGQYVVTFYDVWGNGYLSEFFDDQQNRDNATLVSVTAGEDASGINAGLVLGGSVSGTVTAESGPAIGNCVHAYAVGAENPASGSCADDSGAYTINGLPAGDYELHFDGSQGYLPVWFNNAADRDAATSVPVRSGQNTDGIDQTVVRGASISGTFRDAATGGAPDSQTMCAEAFQDDQQVASYCTWEGEADTYSITGLPAGTYTVQFSAEAYATQWWEAAATQDAATPVTLDLGEERVGIDARFQRLGSITGTVTDAADGSPLRGVCVEAVSQENGWGGYQSCTGEDGTYEITGLPTDDYLLEFVDTEGTHIGEWFDNSPDMEGAQSVPVTAGATASGIDAALENGGWIAGTVTSDATGEPIEGVCVSVLDAETGNYMGRSACTDAAGSYRTTGLPTGAYQLSFDDLLNNSFASEWYDDQPTQDTAQTVPVTKGVGVAQIDAGLVKGASISGTVSKRDDGSPLLSSCVTVLEAETFRYANTSCTEENGEYTVGGLRAGDYVVGFQSPWEVPLKEQWWDDKADMETANVITLGLGEDRVGVDAALASGSGFTGTVTDEESGEPLTGICIEAMSAETGTSVCTDESGHFAIGGLDAGDYRLRYTDPEGPYITEYLGGDDFESATVLTLGEEETVSADAQLVVGGTFSGTVISSVTGEPMEDVCVTAHGTGDSEAWLTTRCTDSSGHYRTAGVRAGDYALEFYAGDDTYAMQWYNGKQDRASANLVTASPGVDTDGIDVTMLRAGRVSGRITSDVDGSPLQTGCATLYSVTGGDPITGGCVEDADGNYVTGGVPAGTYKVEFSDRLRGHLDEFYDDQPDLASANTVTVTVGGNTTGIDAELTAGDPGPDPAAPTNVTATAGDRQAQVSWTAPLQSDGGVITYFVTATPGGADVMTTNTSATVTGLQNGTEYTFTVTADNGYTFVTSAPSNPVTPRAPATAPGAPTGVTATPGDAQAQVTWTAPASDGGSPVTGYTVTSAPGGLTAQVARTATSGPATTATVTGLANGTAYTFTVTATNEAGTSPASAASAAVTPTAPPAPGTVTRWAGADRFASSATFSAKSFAPGVDVAYIASGLNFPDALSAAPIAGKGGDPILLTRPTSLPGPIATELKRLKPKKIVVLGSEGVISKSVATTLKGYATSRTVERWAGADRFASSAIFSAKSFAAGVDVAYISSGENFPDALSAAPIAGKGGDPILLTRATSLPGSIATELKRLKPKKIVVLGSEGVISKSVATTLKGYTTGTVERWAGTDRFASSAIFSAKSFTTGVDTVYISSGENFPDALSAAPIAGRGGSPILLTKTTSLPGPIATELKRLKPRNIVVLGSEGVISKTVADQLKGYLG